MEKSEMMKKFEAETGKCAFISVRSCGNCSDDYIVWLEAKAAAYDRLMSGVWHSGKERPTKTGWYCAVYTTIIISDDGKSTHTGKDELKIVQFHTKRDVWSYWFTNTRGHKIECNNVPKKWMAIPDGWEET